jgi:hypothetical protein
MKNYGDIKKTAGQSNQALVEEKEGESYEYIDKGKETVLPHMSRTGGIEGVTNPYPEIRYRKFEGEAMVDERSLSNIKKDPKGEPLEEEMIPVQPVSLGGDPLEDPSAQPAEPRKQASTVVDPSKIQAQAPGMASGIGAMGVTPTQLEGLMRQMFDNQRVPPPQTVPPPRSMSIPGMGDNKPASAVTSVTFQGPFGEVTAPFAQVIDGEFCIAMVQDLNNQFNYNPPIAEDVPINIEWQDKANTRTQAVVNAGLTFKLDATTKVLVLLKS